MKFPLLVIIAAWFVCAIAGCAKKIEEGKIPITTSSEKAGEEFLKGRDLFEKLLLTNSIKHFDKAISLDSNFASAYLNRANASFTAKDFFAYLKKAVELSDKTSEGEKLTILAADAGANGNTVKQKEYLEKIVSLFPNDERAHYNLGAYFFGLQEYDKSIDQFKKTAKINANYSPVYNLSGYAYRQIENYTEAEKSFKKYTELIPNDPNPYDSYAELLMKIGRFDESIDNYKKALAIDPQFVASRTGIATNYMYKGMYDKGAYELKMLLQVARNDGEQRAAMFTQTVLFVDAGKMDSALLELDKQYSLGKKTNDVVAMSADLGFKGAIFVEMGKFKEATDAFIKSGQLILTSNLSKEVKNNTELFQHYNFALIALGKNELKTAKSETETFKKISEANDNINQIRFSHELLGRIAMLEKNYDLAITELQQSNLQNPYNLYRLAVVFQAKGDKEKATEFYSKAAHFFGLPALNYAFIRGRSEKMILNL
jgi:tetratricopeptide (TPR) repeat protein